MRAAKILLRYLEFVLVALAFDILADFNDLFPQSNALIVCFDGVQLNEAA